MIVVTPCGSGKNKDLILQTSAMLEGRGFVVLAPTLIDMSFADILDAKQALLAWKGGTYSHLQRVRRCEICLICNFGGYIGIGTTLELGYAAALGKLVVALKDDGELARQSIFDHVLNEERPEDVACKLWQWAQGTDQPT
jgi:nucleoside 2-deoxyribosyltransferase